ncbi:MAG: DUF4446 family protein [Mycobacteriales bacterium]|nr:DUF4446 family protein [Mycobacteriales bacterium]
MLLDDSSLEVVALVAAGVAVLSLGLALALLVRVGRLRKAYDTLVGEDASASFVEAIATQHKESEGLRRDVTMLREDLAAARADLSDALRHVAVVRYDAFGDMGGRLSFSAALLDDAGDGLVLTSINGRSETRTYAKGVKGGASGHSLSPEEEQAIGYATRTVARPADEDADLPAAPRRSRRR